MSAKFNPTKFIDKLMSDGKWRSERQIKKALITVYTKQAEQDVAAWLTARSTAEDQGLRLKEMGAYSGKVDRWGADTRYPYWRVEQDPDKITPGDPLKYLPTDEEAREQTIAEAEAEEAARKAKDERGLVPIEE
jgi:hypothetical protein